MKGQGLDRAWVCLGVLGAAHGLRGELVLHSFTDPARKIFGYAPLYDDQGQELRLTPVSGAEVKGSGGSGQQVRAGRLRVRLHGVCDRTGAESWVGRSVCIRRSQLQAPGDEEWYLHDLIGLEARDHADGSLIGHVCQVVNYGAGDLLEIQLAAPGEARVSETSAVRDPGAGARRAAREADKSRGGRDRTVLVPFLRALVPEVQTGQGWLSVQRGAWVEDPPRRVRARRG